MFISLLAVIALGVIAWFGATVAPFFFGAVVPYVAVAVFLAGFAVRIFDWAKSPVPFRIPTTGGQQRSLDFIKPNRLDSPYTPIATIGRMIL